MSSHDSSRPPAGTTTRRTTLGDLPGLLRDRLAVELEDQLFTASDDLVAWLTVHTTPLPTTVVLATGGHLLVAVDTPRWLVLMRGGLATLDTRGLTRPGSAYDVTVNGLRDSGGGTASYVVRTGAPDGLGLRPWVEAAVRAARAA